MRKHQAKLRKVINNGILEAGFRNQILVYYVFNRRIQWCCSYYFIILKLFPLLKIKTFLLLTVLKKLSLDWSTLTFLELFPFIFFFFRTLLLFYYSHYGFVIEKMYPRYNCSYYLEKGQKTVLLVLKNEESRNRFHNALNELILLIRNYSHSWKLVRNTFLLLTVLTKILIFDWKEESCF